MSPNTRRIVIPLVVAGLGLGVVLAMLFGPGRGSVRTTPAPDPPAVSDDGAANGGAANDGATTDETDGAPIASIDEGDQSSDDDGNAAADGEEIDLTALRAVAPERGVSGPDAPPPARLGSLDPDQHRMEIVPSRTGAGIARIAFSDQWQTAKASRQAALHHEDPSETAPDEALRYVLTEPRVLRNMFRPNGIQLPALGAHQIVINGEPVLLLEYTTDNAGERRDTWSEIGPGQFETVVHNGDGDGDPVLRIKRRVILGDKYDFTIEQRFENLTRQPLSVEFSQYGPASLPLDRSRYMDRRRFRFGYVPDPVANPGVVLADGDLMVEQQRILKRWEKSLKAASRGDSGEQVDQLTIWPEGKALENDYALAWFGATNRYYTLTIHPLTGTSLGTIVDRIRFEGSTGDSIASWDQTAMQDRLIFTYLVSPFRQIKPGETLNLDFGVYGGPLDPAILDAPENTTYGALQLKGLILYQMSSFCAICTFQWLAHLLLGILTFFHGILGDWGVSIILLVLCVRTLLHPITKRTQINIQRFSKQMSALKPELDKLQQKFGQDAKRMQQEQLRLFREHGVNPVAGALGCLPMFLQTPIWIALYAMLYFAWPIHQEPAFWGFFQQLNGWSFLADLSAGDHFGGEFDDPRRFWFWNITGINVLPLLMGFLFWAQQKYMSPPPGPNMTPEQIQQQKIIKIIMPLMMPVMLYSAPSGLTLYILTSSTIGILESRWIRNHIKDLDEGRITRKPKKKSKKKPRDAQARAYQQALDRAQEKRREKLRGPDKKFKKRK